MTSLPLGIGALGTMTPMGQGLLPPWVAWLVGLPGDTGPAAATETIAPAGGSAPVVVAPPVPGSGSAGTGAGAGTGLVLVESRPATTVRTSHRAVARPLAHHCLTDRVALAVMAASMAYMFAAMQLMR